MSETSPTLNHKSSLLYRSVLWAMIVLFVVLRLVALTSDAYPRLSWSSALLTDEGYYLHNARNLILYGNSQQDEWNNALVMPTLHALQVGVFRIFGVGIAQTRLISIVFSLVMLGILFFALKRVDIPALSWYAVLFLGLDHSIVLYNRMGLLDTPAACLLVGALACFLGGTRSEKKAFVWGLACGFIFILAYTVRGFAALAFLCPFFALLPVWKEHTRLIVGILTGLIVGMMCYLLIWYLPNRSELSRYNHYYLDHQLIPHSLRRLGFNLWSTLFDWSRGMIPYLIKHTPVVFGLAIIRIIEFFRDPARRDDPFERFLILWLLSMLMLCSAVNYAPSRYYVLFYPPMMILAAMQLIEIKTCKKGERRGEEEKRNILIPALSVQSMAQRKASSREIYFAGLIALWLGVNGYWLTDWLANLQYKQIEADRYLSRTLPSESWLYGSVAPGLTINNRIHPVLTIPGLCNGVKKIERDRGKVRSIVILDGKWRERYWKDNYGTILVEQNKILTLQGLLRPFFEIGVYKVPDDFGSP